MAGSSAKRRTKFRRLRVRISATTQQAFDRLYVTVDEHGNRHRWVSIAELAADWVGRRGRGGEAVTVDIDPGEDATDVDITISAETYQWLLQVALPVEASVEQVASTIVNERGHQLIDAIHQGRRIMGAPPMTDL